MIRHAYGCAALLAVALLAGGCSLGQAARDAGGAAFQGGREAAEKWWNEEGKEKAAQLARAAGESAKEAAIKAAEEKRAELAKKIEDGSASTTDRILYAILTLAAGGGLGGVFMHRSSGAGRQPAP